MIHRLDVVEAESSDLQLGARAAAAGSSGKRYGDESQPVRRHDGQRQVDPGRAWMRPASCVDEPFAQPLK